MHCTLAQTDPQAPQWGGRLRDAKAHSAPAPHSMRPQGPQEEKKRGSIGMSLPSLLPVFSIAYSVAHGAARSTGPHATNVLAGTVHSACAPAASFCCKHSSPSLPLAGLLPDLHRLPLLSPPARVPVMQSAAAATAGLQPRPSPKPVSPLREFLQLPQRQALRGRRRACPRPRCQPPRASVRGSPSYEDP